MKKYFVFIACLLLPPLSFATSESENGTLSWHNYEVTPTHYNKKAKKINCAQFVDQTYTLNEKNGTFSLTGQFEYKNPKLYATTTSHGISSTHWTGTWTYYQPNGKSYTSKIYGAEVAFAKSNLRFGVYKNKYCKGSYRTTWHSPEKKKSKSIISKILHHRS